MRKKLKNIKLICIIYNYFYSFYIWFLNYVISAIPFWCIRLFFYRISGVRIGKGSRIGLHCKVSRPSKIVLGERTIVNEFCYLDGRGGLKIGNDVSISMYSKIITASHYSNSSDFKYFEDEVEIEDHVWIGISAIILNGSFICHGSIIGAGAVFKGRSVENGIYTGSPAKLAKIRNSNLKYKISFTPFFR